MRLLRLTLMVAVVAAPVAIAGSRPAAAVKFCECLSITPSGYCTEYGNCHELERFIGTF
jgi:hypothetical protein